MSMGYAGFFISGGGGGAITTYGKMRGGGRCMVVHCCFYQHLGVLGVHSHDPLGSKDGIWGDDH